MKTHIELHPISIPTKIFSQVGIDLMSLTESEGFDEDGGYKYLISAQCYFSKYVELGALKTKKAEEVSKWIYNKITCRYGDRHPHNGQWFGIHKQSLQRNVQKIGSQFKADHTIPSTG